MWLLLACAETKETPHAASPDGEVTSRDCYDMDADGCDCLTDCDDADPARCTLLDEVCDGVDNDCDDRIDEDVWSWAYDDVDGDGYGDPAAAHQVCEPDAGQVANAEDCDDTDAVVSPAGVETCDGVDEDCDGAADDGATGGFADVDGDGYGDPDAPVACGEAGVANALDCDDGDATEPVVVEDGDPVGPAVRVARKCIAVRTGSHPGNVDLSGRELIVFGDGDDAVIEGEGAGPAVYLGSGDATLRALTISGGEPGVYLGAAASLALQYVRVVDSGEASSLQVEGALSADHVLLRGGATHWGSALALGSEASATIAHLTALGVGGYVIYLSPGATLDLSSSIVVGDGTAACVASEGTVGIAYGDTWGCDPLFEGLGDVTGVNGNLSTDPLFVDAAGGDYRLMARSACIDAGDPNGSDCDGSRADMGAFGGEDGCW